MEDVLNRLKIRNPPNVHLKEGLRIKMQIKDIREETDMDRGRIIERINKQVQRGRVEKEESPKVVEEPKPELEEEPRGEVKRAKKLEKVRMEEPEEKEMPKVEEGVVAEEESEPEEEEEIETKKELEQELEEEPEAAARAKTRKRIQVPEPFKKGPTAKAQAVPYQIRVSPFYMANRMRFLNNINRLFEPYVKEFESSEKNISCAKLDQASADKFDLLFHQKMVRDYLNLFTPYRGLLLYHGLGSGKTVSSITIAEGMKTQKRVIVMTPASLKQNFFNELKRAGDPVFRKNQHWKFVSTSGQPDLVQTLSIQLGIPVEYITKNKGAWLAESNGEPNISTLEEDEQKAIDRQLDEMIRSKYLDLNYNGLNQGIMREITSDYTKNPFDNSVVIIDEAHNLVNRIINKLSTQSAKSLTMISKKVGETTPISLALYEMLMKAKNARIVLLSGTPIINVPNEIAVMYNILRGYITTWTLTVNVETNKKVTSETIREMLSRAGIQTMDYLEYSRNKIVITRNPYGFINNTSGRCDGAAGGKPSEPANIDNLHDQRGGRGGLNKTKKSHSVHPVKSNRTKKNLDRASKSWLSWLRGEEEEEDKETPEHLKGFYDETESVPPPVVPENAQFLPVNEPEMEAHQGGGGGGDDAIVGGADSYKGVCLNRMGNISDHEYITKIKEILNQNGIKILGNEQIIYNKCLPDKQKEFLELFVEEGSGVVKNTDLLTRRILGLTSYFKSAQESLLPRFVKTKDGHNYHIVRTEMSKYQFENYAVVRKEESDKEANARKTEKMGKKAQPAEGEQGQLYDKFTSTYRIMSRACCNFSWPEPPGRPKLNEKEEAKMGEAVETAMIVEGGDAEQWEEDKDQEENMYEEKDQELEGGYPVENEREIDEMGDSVFEPPDMLEGGGPKKKKVTIAETGEQENPVENPVEQEAPKAPKKKAPRAPPKKKPDITEDMGQVDEAAEDDAITNMSVLNALDHINTPEFMSQDGLAQYSPKFLAILRNILEERHQGNHLLYSSFRTLEGIGIFKQVLDNNGFQEFRITKNAQGEWDIDGELNRDLQRYALYTGTEDKEQKEIIRNIYNGAWESVPPTIVQKLEQFDQEGKRNRMGAIIRVFMITASGAEGINLKNTRYVHIVEPYWNMVRIDQVVGRARRICSHEELPPELRTIQVFIYLTVFSEAQKKDRNYNELMAYDISRFNKNQPITTDENLYEISIGKDRISEQILNVMKSSAIDCMFYNKKNPSVCFGANIPTMRADADDVISYPTLEQDQTLQVRKVRKAPARAKPKAAPPIEKVK